MYAEKPKQITDYLDVHASHQPDKEFLFDLEKNRGVSFREAQSLVDRLCFYFQSLGLCRGDRIILYLENSLDFCLLLLAGLRYGAVVCPYPDMFIPAELVRDAALFHPSVVFARPSMEVMLHSCAGRFIPVPADSDWIPSFESNNRAAVFDNVSASPQDISMLYPSAGGVSDPRGILVSRENIESLISSICRGFRFHREDRHLVVLPLSHSAALNYSLFPALLSGASVVITRGFWNIIDEFWSVCFRYKISYIETVPTILYMLLHRPEEKKYSLMLPYVACGSAPLSITIQTEFEQRFGLRVANLYGLTETGPTHVDDPRDPGWKPGSIGRPLDVNRVVILNEEDEALPPGEKGEIAVQGTNVFPGYALHALEGKKRFVSSYFKTGDIGFQDSEGLYYYCDRAKPLIIRGGVNIHPAEVDEVLSRHPAVAHAETVGVPNDFFGEEIQSEVEILEGNSVSEKDLKEYCRQHLSPLKIPDLIRIRESSKPEKGKAT